MIDFGLLVLMLSASAFLLCLSVWVLGHAVRAGSPREREERLDGEQGQGLAAEERMGDPLEFQQYMRSAIKKATEEKVGMGIDAAPVDVDEADEQDAPDLTNWIETAK